MIFTLTALLASVPDPSAAMLVPESAEIPYQINASDRIVIGTVSGIDINYDHTIFTITVEEWLYNPLPAESIKVRTESGKYVWTEDQAEFTLNESVLLMLRDKELDKRLFIVSVGFPGKHPISDRDEVVEELKAQGKWQEENKTGNEKKNETPSGQKPVDSNSLPGQEKAPFRGILWIIVSMLGISVCSGKSK